MGKSRKIFIKIENFAKFDLLETGCLDGSKIKMYKKIGFALIIFVTSVWVFDFYNCSSDSAKFKL